MTIEKGSQIHSAGVEPSGGRAETPHHRKEVQDRGRANTATAAKQLWQAAGHESLAGIMILASAMSHIVGRPATSMGGGTVKTYEAECQPPSGIVLKSEGKKRMIRAGMSADFVISTRR